jgi:4-alpha-glucanotransferase
VDHLVGFYRTYVRPLDGRAPFFLPSEETAQREQGERLLGLFSASGSRITVEDLGVIPEFVRASVTRMGLPGYRVLRWEREHRHAGEPFIDPLSYPAVSVATTGTHDTEPLAVWWESLPAADRRSLTQVPSFAGLERSELDARTRDTILSALYAAGSDILIVPIQDVFGWRDRINKPATVGEWNWTFVLPWPAERLAVEREPLERAEALRDWSDRNQRW